MRRSNPLADDLIATPPARVLHADGKLTPAQMPGEVVAYFRGGRLDGKTRAVIARANHLPGRVESRGADRTDIYAPAEFTTEATYLYRGTELR